MKLKSMQLWPRHTIYKNPFVLSFKNPFVLSLSKYEWIFVLRQAQHERLSWLIGAESIKSIQLKSMQWLAAMVLLCSASWAQAALTCTIPISTGFSTAYAPTGVVPNVTSGTVTFNCTRTVATDATSILLRATNGANASGVKNRAKRTASFISYEAYQDSACTTLWTSLVSTDFKSITLTNVIGAQAVLVNYWGCITLAGQAVAAGTYTDTVTMRVRNSANTASISSNGTFPVSITNPATCTMTTAPGNVAFSYTAFSAAAVTASSTFATTCTLNLPYTMSLDASSGVVSGLNYALVINPSVTPPRGTGAVQTHTINGTMPAGQAGTCSMGTCTGSNVHTLTITY
jgi:spore coat protein U-like protein